MYCTRCGTENHDNNYRCTNCQEILQQFPAQVAPQNRNSNSPVAIVIAVVAVMMVFVIAILGAILFPVFARAREAARKANCQTNLKQIGCALNMYCTDNNDVLPSSAIGTGSKTWEAQRFIEFARGRGNCSPQSGQPGCWNIALSRYIPKPDTFYCAGDSNRSVANSPVSYYWKAAMDYAWYQGFQKSGSYYFRCDQGVVYEHNGWHWGAQRNGLVDGVPVNWLFMDGHVQAKQIQSSGYTNTENPPSPLPASGIGEPAWYNYDYTKLQGPTTDKLWNPQTYGDFLP